MRKAFVLDVEACELLMQVHRDVLLTGLRHRRWQKRMAFALLLLGGLGAEW
jgi:hypothetical protein